MAKPSDAIRRQALRRFVAWLLVLVLIVAAGWWLWQRWPRRQPRSVTQPASASARSLLTPQDRLLILAPHPDDETLGCGGVIQQAVAMQLPVRVVFLTYGDNNEWSFWAYRKWPVVWPKAFRRMGLLRHDEALAAAHLLGLAPTHLTFLGYPDFGTLAIWSEHWGDRPPLRSLLTHVRAVPYESALRPGAPYKGEEILRDLTTVLREFRPTKVFVSHPADYNADHRALYLFTQIALWDVAPEVQPQVYPYLIHFARWPRPRGFHPDRALVPPTALAEQVAWQSPPLSNTMVERKRQALRTHRTQYAYSAHYLLSFARANELFGDFPVITLRAEAQPTMVTHDTGTSVGRASPETLAGLESAAFVGLERRFIHVEGRELVLAMELSQPLAEETQLSVYVFGYRGDRPFAQMPKIHIKLGVLGHTVYDQRRRLPQESITMTRQPRRITIRVPLALLGEPQRILTSARTYLGDVPLDWASWRILELPRAAVLENSR